MKVLLRAALIVATMAVTEASDFCGQWSKKSSGVYVIFNNLWGINTLSKAGKQCTGLTKSTGDTIAWHTRWTWHGHNKSIKSYANTALEFSPVLLSEVTSIPSTMSYKVEHSDCAVADVTYNLFTSSTPTDDRGYEIMISLATIGDASPISSTGKAIDKTTLVGNDWSLFSGRNGPMMVYTFVASKPIFNFEGDLMVFINYLVQYYGYQTNQYLLDLECGMEAFVGKNMYMNVSNYSAAINTDR